MFIILLLFIIIIITSTVSVGFNGIPNNNGNDNDNVKDNDNNKHNNIYKHALNVHSFQKSSKTFSRCRTTLYADLNKR